MDPSDTEFVETHKGKQGCLLAHLDVWRRIVDSGVEYATVLEDDVLFHRDWASLAPAYLHSTPRDWDLLYLGAQMDCPSNAHIAQVPVFCTHAYVITRAGARRLYDLIVRDPLGVRTIDCMLIDWMKRQVYARAGRAPFVWYVWNGTLVAPDPAAVADPLWASRNTGLVFQDAALGTFVREWHDVKI